LIFIKAFFVAKKVVLYFLPGNMVKLVIRNRKKGKIIMFKKITIAIVSALALFGIAAALIRAVLKTREEIS